MTLEERLAKRVRNWRVAERDHRNAMIELDDESDEYWLHKVEADLFERVIAEVLSDVTASAVKAGGENASGNIVGSRQTRAGSGRRP